MRNTDVFWLQVASLSNLAGVFTALAAAVPGFIDWFWGVPKAHPAKRVGLIHMLSNLGALLLFVISAIINCEQLQLSALRAGWGALLSGMGLTLTFVAGYWGGELRGVHHIGVDLSPEQEKLERKT